MKIKEFLRSFIAAPMIRPYEIAPNVPKPTYVLANLIAGRVLRGDWQTCQKAIPEDTPKHYTRFIWKDEKVEIQYTIYNYDKDKVNLYCVRVDREGLNLEGEAEKIVVLAIKKAAEIYAAKQKADAEARKEQKALDAIELLMGLEKANESVVYLDRCPSCDSLRNSSRPNGLVMVDRPGDVY